MSNIIELNRKPAELSGAKGDILESIFRVQGAVELASLTILNEAPESDELMRAQAVLELVARDLERIHGDVERLGAQPAVSA